MPRKQEDSIGRNGVTRRTKPGVPRALSQDLSEILGRKFDQAALGAAIASHITRRRQSRGDVTAGQVTRALGVIRKAARPLDEFSDPRRREELDALIDALDNDSAWQFRNALGKVVSGRQGSDEWFSSTCSPHDIAEAATAALARTHGPTADNLLLETLNDLAVVYKQATRKPVTHFKYKHGLKTDRSQSRFGRFATALFKRIDPRLTPSEVSRGIDRLQAARAAENGQVQSLDQPDTR